MQYIPPLQITKTSVEQITPSASGEVEKALEDNRIYIIEPLPALVEVVLTLAAGFRYCVVDMQTGTTAPEFGLTSGFNYIGADCGINGFTPKPNKHYRLALQDNGISKYAYVEAI